MLIWFGAYVHVCLRQCSVPEIMVFGILFFQVVSYASKLQKQLQVAAQFHGAYVRINEVLKTARTDKECCHWHSDTQTSAKALFERCDFSSR